MNSPCLTGWSGSKLPLLRGWVGLTEAPVAATGPDWLNRELPLPYDWPDGSAAEQGDEADEAGASDGASQLIPCVGPTMRPIVKATSIVTAAVAISLIAGSPATAKVVPATLAELVQRADFVGIVRVDSVSTRIPLLKRRRASATILQSWKGQRSGTVRFIAQATWTCDISEARAGEEAIVFIEGDRLVLAGRGRMPIFAREGRRLAAVWPDVRLPPGLGTEDGPEPEYGFIRGVGVAYLAAAVAASSSTSIAE